MRRSIRGGALAVPFSVAMSLVLAGQVAAASWSPPTPVAPGAIFTGVVGLNFYELLAVYSDEIGVFAKRSPDRGKTWQTPVPIASDAFAPGIARRGSTVHVVFHRGENLGGYGEIAEVWYTRSTDGGESYASPMLVAGPNSDINSGGVLTGPDGLVVLVWSTEVWNGSFDDVSQVLRIKVSTNGGASFGSPRKIFEYDGAGGASLAIGDGVMYLAYQRDYSRLRIIRSLNMGVSWSAPTIVTNDSSEGEFSLTTEGQTAILAYVHTDFSKWNWGAIRYRRTTNGGQTWSSTRSLTTHRSAQGRAPVFLLRNGVVHALFRRDGEVVYRRSLDGVTWTRYEPVAALAWPQGIVLAGRVIAIYEADGSAGFTSYLSRRI